MNIPAALGRFIPGEEDDMPDEPKSSCTPLTEREIGHIYSDIRAIRQAQDTHFRTLVGYMLGATLTVITVISGFGVALLSKLH